MRQERAKMLWPEPNCPLLRARALVGFAGTGAVLPMSATDHQDGRLRVDLLSSARRGAVTQDTSLARRLDSLLCERSGPSA
jgi:hypothetical protein